MRTNTVYLNVNTNDLGKKMVTEAKSLWNTGSKIVI